MILTIIGMAGLACEGEEVNQPLASGGGSSPTTIQSSEQGTAAAGSGILGGEAGATFVELSTLLSGSSTEVPTVTPLKSRLKKKMNHPSHVEIMAKIREISQAGLTRGAVNSLKTAHEKSVIAQAHDITICDGVQGTKDVEVASKFVGSEVESKKTTITFTNCRLSNELITGLITVTEFFLEPGQPTEVLYGNDEGDFIIKRFPNDTSSNVVSTYTANLLIRESSSVDQVNSEIDFSLEVDGFVSYEADGELAKISFEDFVSEGSVSDSPHTVSHLLNGGVSIEWEDSGGAHLIDFAYEQFHVSLTKKNGEDGYEETSLSGTITVQSDQEADCDIEGTFLFETVAPIHIVEGASCPVSGHLKINDNTDVLVNDDGSVDVTVNETDVTHYDSCSEFQDHCDPDVDLGVGEEN